MGFELTVTRDTQNYQILKLQDYVGTSMLLNRSSISIPCFTCTLACHVLWLTYHNSF